MTNPIPTIPYKFHIEILSGVLHELFKVEEEVWELESTLESARQREAGYKALKDHLSGAFKAGDFINCPEDYERLREKYLGK